MFRRWPEKGCTVQRVREVRGCPLGRNCINQADDEALLSQETLVMGEPGDRSEPRAQSNDGAMQSCIKVEGTDGTSQELVGNADDKVDVATGTVAESITDSAVGSADGALTATDGAGEDGSNGTVGVDDSATRKRARDAGDQGDRGRAAVREDDGAVTSLSDAAAKRDAYVKQVKDADALMIEMALKSGRTNDVIGKSVEELLLSKYHLMERDGIVGEESDGEMEVDESVPQDAALEEAFEAGFMNITTENAMGRRYKRALKYNAKEAEEYAAAGRAEKIVRIREWSKAKHANYSVTGQTDSPPPHLHRPIFVGEVPNGL